MPVWDFDNPSSIKSWEDASASYADQVSGDIRAVVGDKLRNENIWENVELPKLMLNENVFKITTINPNTMEETVIFERDFVGNIKTYINDTLASSGEWNKIIESLKNNDSIKSITITDSSGKINTIFRR